MREALFEREYHTLVRLKHPRIIEVYDYGIDEHGPYYTMELLDGSDLRELAPLPWQRSVPAPARRGFVARAAARAAARASRHQSAQRAPDRRRSRQADRLRRDGALRAPARDRRHAAVHGARGAAPRCRSISARICIALGAVAYWALTGRHAYPARQLAGPAERLAAGAAAAVAARARCPARARRADHVAAQPGSARAAGERSAP